MNFGEGLQSPDTDKILNTIDELRSQGIGDVLELPQIIVCGDQSSGKSSVLNAVSTLKFPTKDALCTRFATEVIMRPGAPEHIVVSIVPGNDRSSKDKQRFENFRRNNVTMNDIGDLIEEATELMGIKPQDPRAKRFSNDILRFEVTGPTQPSLTLVDLPGLFQAPSKDQTDEDTQAVQDLVLKYMNNKRSVILAVISAKSDFVLQAVTKYSRKVDPRGLRTLGIITKPDKLDVSSESETKFMELAENRLAHLYRGWHVLVNRDYTTRENTQDERDQFEKEFLSHGVWARLPSNNKGVFSLRSRLSGLLRDQILKELPGLVEDAEREIEKHQSKLHQLGMSRRTPEDRRRYLTQASQTFNVTIRSCINSPYDDDFFNIKSNDDSKQKRLRAIVQNNLLAFGDAMQRHGHAMHIVDHISPDPERSHPTQVTQEEYEDGVMELMKENRGRELIGTVNPLLVRELFVAQSKPWAALIEDCRKRIWVATEATIDLALQYATDETTMMRLKQFVIDPSFNMLKTALDDMINRLLALHKQKHPITYNRRLVESIYNAKQAHAEKITRERLVQVIELRGEPVAKALDGLFKQQNNIQPKSLERYAASELIEAMRAYYKIAKETLVDNFGTLAIEDCLISQLPDLLSPRKIAALDDDTIEAIAMETDTAASERVEAEERLQSSTAALHKLMAIEKRRQPGKSSAGFPPSRANNPEAPRMEVILQPSQLFEQRILDEDDALDDIPLQGGTELSKQDVGISDFEDRQTVSTNHVDAHGFSKARAKLDLGSSNADDRQTVSTNSVNGDDVYVSKKKRMKVRSSWVDSNLASPKPMEDDE